MNTLAAAEMIEERIAETEALLKQQCVMRDVMIAQGDDLTDIKRIVIATENIIKENKKAVKVIKDSLKCD